MSGSFVEEVGRRLRAIRRQQHLSLEEVEERSNGRWSASAIGAYERGYRVLSLGRLRELAEFYNVPISVLVGEADQQAGSIASGGDAGGHAAAGRGRSERLVLDLSALHDAEDAAPVARYAHAIAVERGDFNGRVLSLRREDLRVLSTLLELREDELHCRFEEWGILRHDPDDVIDLTAPLEAEAAAVVQAHAASS